MLEEYNEFAKSLPYLNNMNDHDPEMVTRFESLNKTLWVMFAREDIISPRESSWFGYYDENFNIIPFQETAEYLSNSFGLKTIDE